MTGSDETDMALVCKVSCKTFDQLVCCPAVTPQGFRWAVDQDRWHDRVASIPAVFEAAAADLGAPAVDSRVVRAVWERLLPGA